MPATELADLIQRYGGWGLSAILMGAVVYLHRGWQGCQDIALRDRERLITALEAAKDASERFEGTLQSLRATLESRGQAVADLSHQVENVAIKVQHGIGNLSASMEGFVRMLDRDRDRGRP